MIDNERNAELAEGRKDQRCGKMLSRGLEARVSHEKMDLTKLTILYRGYETFLVVTAHNSADNTDWVAFYTGSDVAGAVVGLGAKMSKGKVKWKEETPYAKRVKQD